MGTSNIEFDIPDGPRSKVESAFKAQQRQDASNNGSREGYSGDFQTVSSVDFHSKEFTDYNEAHDYCLDNAEKWSTVVAVKYKCFNHLKKSGKALKFISGELVSNKLLTLKERLVNEKLADSNLRDKITKGIKEAKSKTIGCKNCNSQVNRKYVKQVLCCPVCSNTLMSPTAVKQLKNKGDKLADINKQIKEETNKLKTKNSKLAKTRWLIAGWGAS